MLWICLSSARSREFFMIKRNRMELNTGKIIEEKLVQSDFYQTIGDKFPFQQDNSLKHKVKYTLELLTKTTLNVTVTGFSFYLNRLENRWQDIKMAV